MPQDSTAPVIVDRETREVASAPASASVPSRAVVVSVSLTVTAQGAPEDAERLANAVLAAARTLAPIVPGGGG